MKAQRLVVYLTQMVKYELRIEIARQILAQNMNFSPAWVLAILHQNQNQPENQNLRISHFLRLFDIINYKCTKQEATTIFEYFDQEKKNQVQNKHFVEILMPTHREGLRKAVAKRTAEDIEWSKDLKYAFKRFFLEVQVCSRYLQDYETDFIDLSHSFAGNNQLSLSRGQVSDFLKKYNKFPTDSQLHCIMTQIDGKRLKQINENVLRSIIRESLKDKTIPSEDPLHSSYRGNRQTTQKSNYANKTFSDFPQTKVLKTVSIYKQEQAQSENKESTKFYPGRDFAQEREGEKTPIDRISKNNFADESYKIHYPSQRKQPITDITGLQNQNEQMRSEINQRKVENSKLMNSIRHDLRTLGNH